MTKYEEIKSIEKSGWSEDDYMTAAIKDYKKKFKIKFLSAKRVPIFL